MSQLKLTIVGDPTPLRNATRKAQGSLRNLSKTADTVGRSMNKAFSGVGLGIGLAVLVNGLKNATKAASEDVKSQGLLAVALKNTLGATNSAIAGAESYIKTTQLQTAVLDDELRPALAQTVRATGSLSTGQRLLDIALDVSAGTGKDLTSVTSALSKAYTGNTATLKRLIPGIQLTSNWMGDLETKFEGSAEAAANLDPYKRLEVIFADIQETVGMALLPALEQFSAYLASPAGQENVRELVDLFVQVGTAVGNVVTYMIQNIDLVKSLATLLVAVKISMGLIAISAGLVNANILKAVTATKLLKIALISTGFGAIAVIAGSIAASFAESAESADSIDTSMANISDRFNDDGANVDNLGPNGIPLWSLGYATIDEYNAAEAKAATIVKNKKAKAVADAKALADKVRAALNSKIEQMKSTAEDFRDAVSVSFGLFGEDEYSVFNVDYFKAKLQRMVTAAKGFAANLKTILKTPGSQPLVDELIAMGPVEGNIAAKALLASGDLKEIVGLKSSLYQTGTQAGAVQATMGNASYEININKAVISAADIIKEIRILEKKTGRKYLVGN
jgi:hypothetical protein